MPVEKDQSSELEEEYIREGLELAREQIALGETSIATLPEVIAEAQQRHDS
ncbi:MAG: hypothetical protein WD971_13495 [Pirellulales bacterium]